MLGAPHRVHKWYFAPLVVVHYTGGVKTWTSGACCQDKAGAATPEFGTGLATVRLTVATVPASRGWHHIFVVVTIQEERMKRFVIERHIPQVGSFEREQLRAAAQKSNQVLQQLGPDIQWVESFVAGDKTFCIYLAKSEDIIHQHAALSGFPATRVTEITRMIDPATAVA